MPLSLNPYDVELIAASENPEGQRLLTFRCCVPRIILAELNTHRVLSRNAASSRAIPTRLLIERVMTNPYIPDWTARSAGMSGDIITDLETVNRLDADYLHARNETVASVIQICTGGVRYHADAIPELEPEFIASLLDSAKSAPHKQDINRLLEPFLFMEWIVSGTDWSNFFFQRVHKDAHPAIQKIAYRMACLTLKPNSNLTDVLRRLDWGDWHLPFITDYEWHSYGSDSVLLAQVSAARCGRVSFAKEGTRNSDISDDFHWFGKHVLANLELGEPPHVSPAEHPAQARRGRYANFTGFEQLRKLFKGENRDSYTLEYLERYERDLTF